MGERRVALARLVIALAGVGLPTDGIVVKSRPAVTGRAFKSPSASTLRYNAFPAILSEDFGAEAAN
jgi:hypothetical protein